MPAARWFLPVNGSAQGTALDQHLLLNLWIALFLLLLLHFLLLAGLLLRRRPDSIRASLIKTFPVFALALLFAFLGVRAERLWAASRYTGPDPAALQVEVTGMQFAWYFRYPGQDYAFGHTNPALVAPPAGNPLGLDQNDPHATDDFITSELVLPANREVDLHLRAQDVIHGFAIPEMRIKQNAVPGQNLHLHFTPNRVGTYAILCTQLCGLGHYRMSANLRVLTAGEFAAWLRRKEMPPNP